MAPGAGRLGHRARAAPAPYPVGIMAPLRVLLARVRAEDAGFVRQSLAPSMPSLTLETVDDLEDLPTVLASFAPDVVISDDDAAGEDFLGVIDTVKRVRSEIPVVMLTDPANEHAAVDALQRGLDDYVIKTRDGVHRLPVAVGRVLELRASRQHAQHAEMRFLELLDRLDVGAFRIDRRGAVLDANPALGRLLGEPDGDSVRGREIGCYVVEEKDRTRLIEESSALRGERMSITRADGSPAVFEFDRSAPVTEGDEISLDGLVKDVTREFEAERELAERERQLQRAQRLESIGLLAAGVAHDFNNILMAVLLCSEYLMKDLDPSSKQWQDASRINAAGDRARVLTRQLLAFSRRQFLAPAPVDLNATIEGLNAVFRSLVGESISLELRLDPEVPRAHADPAQVEQIVMNLVVNARDAVEPGGRIIISTGAEATKAAGPDRTALAVEDDGCGIEAAMIERIFEPFFTTKSGGRGTGLGLSTVHGIVAQSGGLVSVRSRPGRGSTFIVELPVSRAEAEVRAPQPAFELGTVARKVLLVEDDPVVRRLVSRALREDDHLVFDAGSGSQALAIAEQRGPFDLLLTDVVLPQMTGVELAERIRSQSPRTRVLYMTGYADDGQLGASVTLTGPDHLRKPFGPTELRLAVRDVLADR